MNDINTKASSLKQEVRRIHFIGVGGCGMSGIAKLLCLKGYAVSGSDLKDSATTKALTKLGVAVFKGHAAQHCQDKDLVVISSAIDAQNPEVLFAKKQGTPVIQRAEMLSYLMHSYLKVLISGTHGKTTSTSMLAHIFIEAELDPSFIIGGTLKNSNTGAQLGNGPYFIGEADESDASFLHLTPNIACITNIDTDHMENFQDDPAQLEAAFKTFLQRLPRNGLAVLCHDDERLAKLQAYSPCKVLTFGLSQKASVYAENISACGAAMQFVVKTKNNETALPVTLNLPGIHNVLNALCAITVALHLGISKKHIQQALASFQGAARRFDIIEGKTLFTKKLTLIDDYGHHPREIQVTLNAIRQAYPNRRILHIFQPHRYSRTKTHFSEFATALAKADQLVLLPIFAASEKPINGITSEALARNIEGCPVKVLHFSEVSACLKLTLKDNDVLLIQGAGNVGKLAISLCLELMS